MTNRPHLSHEEARLSAVLRAVDRHIAPPDPVALAKLRETSLVAFEQRQGYQAFSITMRPPMFALAVRAVVALAASVMLAAVWLNPWTTTTVSGAPFERVLKSLREAESLHLTLLKADETAAEVYIRRPGLVRMEQSPERYQIAAGSRWWRVDEASNTVATGDSPWFRSADQQVDLLKLLDVGVNDARPLLRSRPSEAEIYEGRECLVYRSTLQGEQGPLEIAAFADAVTGELAGITARGPNDRRGVGPPLAELKLVAVNAVVEEEKFVVAKTLTEDGRIGKLTDAQGIVLLRPMLAERWTPICREVLLKPGDWLRTEIRGANAVKASLSSKAEITVGPGSLLECISPTEARLHYGELQVNVPKGEAEFTLLAPRDGKEKFAEGKQMVRVDREEKLAKVGEQPLWLKGFEGTTNNESLGSLLVKVDGREVPLSVGYHKVSVEIRDQIARTTIEESFVNHTPGRLEGVFHFPLPQDASISGFGMWIGNELVEADVVEKQRAREIYETILREKRDPGLLEWTSGNLFKARVFPIEPQSEKRVKIVYTQVLPLRGNRYRYSYALQSDLLKTKPLRELSLNVLVNSALSLKSVVCSTHPARTQQTAHSAQVEFAQQEYTPTRDFEVVCEVDAKQTDLVVIPHRRGDDGYLLMQLMPPGGEGDFQREVVRDGEPLSLVLLCDTSASMDVQKRKDQAEFLAATLASLSEKDHFNLAACDVGTAWAFKESVPATADNVGKAKVFLEQRVSLGWTDLARGFTDVLKKSPVDAHVVYVGDGMVTAGETDPSSFINQLGRIVAAGDAERRRVFHAVTVGNAHEAMVLRGIANLRGGSVRAISGEQTPQKIALELLNEIAQPGLTDVEIEYQGIKVAAVYPERLPNLAAGTQQILVGRYLPQGKDQEGKVIITGMQGGEKVRYEAQVKLKDAEEGNSFIPRLWARSHLDFLLAQGQSEQVQADVISLSEQFHIITPYTSLLVLETDADRERFGVKRRYEMRNGERFFAQGKANANFELLQQQMKRASDWRIALRAQVLRQLSQLGRHPQQFQQQVQLLDRLSRVADERSHLPTSSSGALPAGMGGGGAEDWGFITDFDKLPELMTAFGVNGPVDELTPRKLELRDAEGGEMELYFGRPERKSLDEDQEALAGLKAEAAFGVPLNKSLEDGFGFGGLAREAWEAREEKLTALQAFDESPGFMKAKKPRGGGMMLGDTTYYDGYYGPDYTAWMNTLFPALAAPVKEVSPVPKDPEGWSAEAIELSKSLLRNEWLVKLEEGLQIRRTADTFDPAWERRSSHNVDLALYSTKSWLTRTLDPEDHTIVEFCDEQQRGAISRPLLLGRVRSSTKHDLANPALYLEYFHTTALHHSQHHYSATVEAAGENQVRLVLTSKDESSQLIYTIDTARHAVLKLEQFSEGEKSSSTIYSDFVEVAGAHFATRIVILDKEDEKVGETTFEIKSLPLADYQAKVDEELACKTTSLLLTVPLPKLREAQKQTLEGKASVEHLLVMVLHNCVLQQWDEVLKHVEAIEKQSAGKPGVRWIRTILLSTMRRSNDARLRLLAEAKQLATGKSPDEIFLADFVLSQASSVATGSELEEFAELLRAVYERQPEELNVVSRWRNYQLSVLEQLGRSEEVLALRRQIAEESPWDVSCQTTYVSYLARAGHTQEAIAWLETAIARPEKRGQWDQEALRSNLAEQYRSQSRWSDLLEFTTDWIATDPHGASAYSQHLSALVFNDRLDDANAQALQWLTEHRVERKLTPPEKSRLDAAIQYAVGNAYNLNMQRMEPRWNEPLAETARYFTRHKHHFDVVRTVFDYRFGETDAADRVRGFFLKLLQTELASLTPQQSNYLVNMSLSGRLELAEPIGGRRQMHAGEMPKEIWAKIAAELRERWSAEKKLEEKHLLSDSLRNIYVNRFADTEYLPFLRERIATSHPDYKRGYTNELFEALLTRPWSDELEAEAFATWGKLSDEEPAEARLVTLVPALYRLVDTVVANRQAAFEKTLHDSGDSTKLTRTELVAKRAEAKTEAMMGVARRLADLAKDRQDPLANWLQIERTYLEVKTDHNLEQVEEVAWQLLDKAPPKPDDEEEEDLTLQERRERFFGALLRQRALMTVMNLAARKNAKQATIDRALAYIEAGIDQQGAQADFWRGMKFNLLVALDRADDLEKQLTAWIKADDEASPWRTMLGILLAERGKIEEAIRLFERAEKHKLLTAAHYRMLADWYVVVNQRADSERTRIEVYKQLPEYHLTRMIDRTANRWYDTHRPLPSELDEETLFIFKALFEKSASPENYFHQLQRLYQACRDFRLLQMVPDSLLGRSPQQVYSYLQAVRGYILAEVRNEATADEILARVQELRKRELTAIDARALDLLEAMVEAKAATVLNQPGPHVRAAVAAMQRAFERSWDEGEPRLMSSLLRSMGSQPQKDLVDEQFRELRALRGMVEPQTREHLVITNDLAQLMFLSDDQRDAALQMMQSEVGDYLRANQGHWPHDDNGVLSEYVTMLEQAHHHAAGENLLQKQVASTQNAEQKKFLQLRLIQLYHSALASKTTVSLGSGRELFERAVDWGVELNESTDDNHRHSIAAYIVALFSTAQSQNIAGREAKLRTYAFETPPGMLKRLTSQYHNTATQPLEVIAQTLGPKEALRYVVERMEQYPARLEVGYYRAWQTFGSSLAYYRHEAEKNGADLADLEPRVLELAITELKRHLAIGDHSNLDIFHRGYTNFWKTKSNDFARAAEEVLGEDRGSGRRAMAVANYLRHGLDRSDRSIEVLLVAHERGLLDVNAQDTLVQYLQSDSRYAESVPILQGLVRYSPDSIEYRVKLMIAYHNTQRGEQLLELLSETDKHFHQQGRWTAENIARLAEGCLSCGLYQQSIGYLTEATSQRQRSQGGITLGDQTLSGWYQLLAGAHAAVGDTKAAVDAASSAIVSWGAKSTQRKHAIDALRRVLEQARNLDAYVNQLDQETQKSEQDSPLLRKMLGLVYQAKGEHQKAATQLAASIELQPNDKETHQALIATYDKLGQNELATSQLLRLIAFDRHDLALYTQLAERLSGDEAQAERAATTIIEAAPTEAENHAAYAELLQKRHRWDKAIGHWTKVSELRRLEPTGLLKLAEAQIHEKKFEDAQATIEKLHRTAWPARFTEVSQQTRMLQEKLPRN